MDYVELAERFLLNMQRFRSRQQQKQVDRTMQGEVFAVLHIWQQGGISMPSDLSERMNVSSARVAAMLNNLEAKGFLRRATDPEDRRRVLIDLTDEGVALAEREYGEVVRITSRMLQWLGPDDADQLVRIAGKLATMPPDIGVDED